MHDGSTVYLRRHGNPDGPRLVLTHGNGLAIDLYYPFWSRLTDDFDIVVYDLRNHGWNEVSDIEKHNMPSFVDDHDRVMESIDRVFGDRPKIGVFHSVSALISLLSPTGGSGFAGRFLFDPPLCKPGRGYREMEAAATQTAALDPPPGGEDPDEGRLRLPARIRSPVLPRGARGAGSHGGDHPAQE